MNNSFFLVNFCPPVILWTCLCCRELFIVDGWPFTADVNFFHLFLQAASQLCSFFRRLNISAKTKRSEFFIKTGDVEFFMKFLAEERSHYQRETKSLLLKKDHTEEQS